MVLFGERFKFILMMLMIQFSSAAGGMRRGARKAKRSISTERSNRSLSDEAHQHLPPAMTRGDAIPHAEPAHDLASAKKKAREAEFAAEKVWQEAQLPAWRARLEKQFPGLTEKEYQFRKDHLDKWRIRQAEIYPDLTEREWVFKHGIEASKMGVRLPPGYEKYDVLVQERKRAKNERIRKRRAEMERAERERNGNPRGHSPAPAPAMPRVTRRRARLDAEAAIRRGVSPEYYKYAENISFNDEPIERRATAVRRAKSPAYAQEWVLSDSPPSSPRERRSPSIQSVESSSSWSPYEEENGAKEPTPKRRTRETTDDARRKQFAKQSVKNLESPRGDVESSKHNSQSFQFDPLAPDRHKSPNHRSESGE